MFAGKLMQVEEKPPEELRNAYSIYLSAHS